MTLTIKAMDQKAGMGMEELQAAMVRADRAGFVMLGRTRIGWRGQILSIEFREPPGYTAKELALGDDEVHA